MSVCVQRIWSSSVIYSIHSFIQSFHTYNNIIMLQNHLPSSFLLRKKGIKRMQSTLSIRHFIFHFISFSIYGILYNVRWLLLPSTLWKLITPFQHSTKFHMFTLISLSSCVRLFFQMNFMKCENILNGFSFRFLFSFCCCWKTAQWIYVNHLNELGACSYVKLTFAIDSPLFAFSFSLVAFVLVWVVYLFI